MDMTFRLLGKRSIALLNKIRAVRLHLRFVSMKSLDLFFFFEEP